jgi:hypothetical protein
MSESRRAFLGLATGWAAAAALRASSRAAQQRGPLNPYTPAVPFDKNDLSVKPSPRQLKARQKDLKKDVTRLSQLAQQLQKELDETDTADVLPLDVIRKTSEIEKLAKHIQDAVRG